MPHRRPNHQKNFQCDFCPTHNSWVKYILVGNSKKFICPECIAELARQIKKERADKDANSRAGANPDRGIRDNTPQTENSPDAT